MKKKGFKKIIRKNMHILMISLDFPPIVGGISAHVYELSKHLVKNGCEVTILTRQIGKKASFERIENINIYRMDLKFFGFTYGIQINNFAKKLIKQLKPNLVHIHGMRPLEFYNIDDVPLVYTNHTSGYLKRLKKGGYRIYQLKKIFKKPDLFLAPSKELLEAPFEIKAKKKYIPNGVEVEKYKRNLYFREKIRKKLKINSNEKLGIVTRRLVWKNGVFYLAEATKYIKNKNLKILVIGNGEEYEKIKTTMETYFKNRYFMLGAKTHDEIIPYYSAADFSILPSLMEATSISGLESMAASLPLIGTEVGGIPELIDEGKNGFLVKPENPVDLAEKIDMLLNEDLEKFGQYSFKKVTDNFEWRIIAKKTLKAYEEIM